MRNQTEEFGIDTIIFEKFKKKMFDFMCHMMGCNSVDSCQTKGPLKRGGEQKTVR